MNDAFGMDSLEDPWFEQLLWVYWRRESVSEDSIDEMLTNVTNRTPSVSGILVKVMNHDMWESNSQGAFGAPSGNSDLHVTGIDSVLNWIDRCEDHGLSCHIWAVPGGQNIEMQAAMLATAASLPGVRSLMLDVEPGAQFWNLPVNKIDALCNTLFQSLPRHLPVALNVDPRVNARREISLSHWLKYPFSAVMPMVYWDAFGTQQGLDGTPQTALNKLCNPADYNDLPVYPMLSTCNVWPHSLAAALRFTRQQWRGASLFRYGVVGECSTDELCDVIADAWE